jgi:hypothetical protein
VAPVTRQALRGALMPTINSMSATGVVSMSGMMTGQILGGVSPAEAVKYQILVMFMIAGRRPWYRNSGARWHLPLHRPASPPPPRSAGVAEAGIAECPLSP